MSTERLDEALVILRSLRDDYDRHIKQVQEEIRSEFNVQQKTVDTIGTLIKLSGVDATTMAVLSSHTSKMMFNTSSLMLDKLDKVKSTLCTLILEELSEASEVLNGKSLVVDDSVSVAMKELFSSDFDYQMENETSKIVDDSKKDIMIAVTQPETVIVSAISDAGEQFLSNIINLFTKTANNLFSDLVRLMIRDTQLKCVNLSTCDVTTKAECWCMHGVDVDASTAFTIHGSDCKCVPLFYVDDVIEDVKSVKSEDTAFESLKTYEAKSVLGEYRYSRWLKGDSLNVLLTVDEGNSEQA